MAQRQAEDLLKTLRRQYVEALQAQSVVLSLFGDPALQQQFRDVAVTEGIQLTANLNDLWGAIARKIEPGLGSHRTWSVHQHARCIELASNAAVDLGLQSIEVDNRPPVATVAVPEFSDVVSMVRHTVKTHLGNDIQTAFIRGELRQAALTERVTPTKKIGVLLLGAQDAAEAADLTMGWPSRASATLEAPAEASPASVEKAFKATLRHQTKLHT